MSSSHIVQISPKEIIIYKTSENSYSSATITIKNISSGYIIFKPMIRHKDIYTIKSESIFLKPNESTKCIIKKHLKKDQSTQAPSAPTSSQLITNKPDKILFLIYQINKAISSKEEAKKILSSHDINDPNQKEVVLIREENYSYDIETFNNMNIQEIEKEIFNMSCSSSLDVENLMKSYTLLVDKVKNEKIKVQKEIENNEERLDNIMKNKELNMQKMKAIGQGKEGDKGKKGGKRLSIGLNFYLILCLMFFVLGGFINKKVGERIKKKD